MYYEVYIDLLIYVNFCMDFLILRMTAYILKEKIKFTRLLFASLFSSVVCSLFLCFAEIGHSYALLFVQILCSLCALTAFRYHSLKNLVQQFLCNGLLTFLFGGAQEWLLRTVYRGENGVLPFTNLLISSVLFYQLVKWFISSLKQRRCQAMLYSVELKVGNDSLYMKGLLDTGNRLMEPVGKRPVSVLGAAAAKGLKPPEDAFLIIPYRAVGTQSGILFGFVADDMKLIRDKEVWEIEKPVIGISKEQVSTKQEYDMLLNPLLFC